MVSVVGVSPLPAGALPSTTSPPPAAGGADPRAAGVGEQAPSGRGAEIAERVEAARQADRMLKIRDEERRGDAPPAPAPDRPALLSFLADQAEGTAPPLLPPDRSAPTGPPPAFDRSPLDAERELRLGPDGTTGEPPPIEEASTPARPAEAAAPESDDLQGGAEQPEPAGRELAQADVPPTADERAQTEFTSVRRMETPYDTATVDVTR